ncbi:response regulator transcription factor [Gallaecimonas sp. GXIMD4217]|uniref:response regulator transcription factor n=1 Tax=Gallaecimonas sp. GXIMD4217 TaxID=3131927 RepID=UPI00311AEA6F
MIRILVADDHTIVRQGLVSLLDGQGEIRVIGQASDGMEAVEKALELKPDILVTDVTMPRLNGIEVVRRLHQQQPQIRVLVLTMHEEEEYVLHMVKAGAAGYLVKDSASAELCQAVLSLAQGKGYFSPRAAQILADSMREPERDLSDPYGDLTNREREVFHLVIEGRTTKEIASRLDISVKTAENHRTRLMDKLQVHNTAELVRLAVRRGLLT